ncbi:hypothetical protein BKA66DRAFT_165403 [Pyrenochaeta sp. MPI-SDFR-AT-0127]|nr:hypothetical protein BKA66DRAFT_165403 [Pyrenochaeta sp. MPI-SDFR-AT-0127]
MSMAHWLCPECGIDMQDRTSLMTHHRNTGCLFVCDGCSDGAGFAWSRDCPEYWDHVVNEHVCTICGQHFDSESYLWHHSLTHRAATVKCLACPRKFTTYSGMIIHLEAGTCNSGIDALDLNKSAAICYQWRKWIAKDCRSDLKRYMRFKSGVLPFRCPVCKASLPKLSSLFNHIATSSCAQRPGCGVTRKLKRWLWRRHREGQHRK